MKPDCLKTKYVANFCASQLKENLRGIPHSLSELVEHSLDRLCSQHRGLLGLRWALAALTVSPTGRKGLNTARSSAQLETQQLSIVTPTWFPSFSAGLREGHLYSVLNTCCGLSSQCGQVSWQQALQLSRKPKERIPMTTFTHIVHSLKR